MNAPVGKLKKLLPEFEKVAERIRRDIKNVQITVKFSSFNFPNYEIQCRSVSRKIPKRFWKIYRNFTTHYLKH